MNHTNQPPANPGRFSAPQIEVFQEADFLGVTMRCVHDFGVGPVSPIGCWRNPGA